MPARNARGQFMRDDGFNINITHPFTILKYLIFFIVLFPLFKMLERKDLFNYIYDKYVAPCDCQCPINKTNKSEMQNGGWVGK